MITFAAHSIVVSHNGQRAADALHRGVPFCICHLPGAADTRFYSLTGNPDTGAFVIHPWNDGTARSGEVWMYRAELPHTPLLPAGTPPAHIAWGSLPEETGFEAYSRSFFQFQKAMEDGKVRKAVLSRVKREHKPSFFEPISFFAVLATEYPDSMTYLLYHPEVGMWAAATPEVLLARRNGSYRTVSLAGTARADMGTPPVWGQKEREEQELVSEHIRSALREAGVDRWRETGPYSKRAGNVVHLETSFEWNLESGIDFMNYLLADLHPTPAVSGLPSREAAALIQSAETHRRGLYTGYLGTLDLPWSANLYVNLRCMQIGQNDIALYVGGGITPQSRLKAEWEETELKLLTLLKYLHA